MFLPKIFVTNIKVSSPDMEYLVILLLLNMLSTFVISCVLIMVIILYLKTRIGKKKNSGITFAMSP